MSSGLTFHIIHIWFIQIYVFMQMFLPYPHTCISTGHADLSAKPLYPLYTFGYGVNYFLYYIIPVFSQQFLISAWPYLLRSRLTIVMTHLSLPRF